MTKADELIEAGRSEAAKKRARTMLSNFRQFIKDNRDEIEAIQVLYSRPYRAGLRYQQVKELAAAIARPPLAGKPADSGPETAGAGLPNVELVTQPDPFVGDEPGDLVRPHAPHEPLCCGEQIGFPHVRFLEVVEVTLDVILRLEPNTVRGGQARRGQGKGGKRHRERYQAVCVGHSLTSFGRMAGAWSSVGR